ADYALIREMASVTHGDYYRALSAQETAGIFDQIHARMSLSRPTAPPSAALPSAAGLPSRSVSLLAYAWFWILGVPALVILLAAALFLSRRLRPGIAPRRSGPAPGTTTTARPPAEPQIPQASLREMHSGNTVSLTKRLTRIGRAPDNDLVIAERQVSSHHAEVEFRQDHFYVRDLRSTNGTSVNKQPVEGETLLKSGDVIRFDEYAYTFFLLGAGSETTGTMLREHIEGTMVSEAHKLRPTAPVASETAFMDSGATVDDSVGPARCPAHPSFEATELCERCGHQWCALCNPPIPGERVCRKCRETGKGQPNNANSHVHGTPAHR
ncbi:MAG TPA: FHA domain-containing protein, partial [Candidatus Acidoferrum sp.]|nr:FHA domain-containing protein [Candidatus Acidoferrum sp.]